MKRSNFSYLETFPEDFYIKHKVAEQTEKTNFHIHRQMEIIYTLSGNLRCRTEERIIDIPENAIVLMNSMELHYFFAEEGSGLCDRYVLYFSSPFISPLSTPEINLLECFTLHPSHGPLVLDVPAHQTEDIQRLLNQMEAYFLKKNSVSNDTLFGTVMHIKFLLGQLLLLANQMYFQEYGRNTSALFRSHAQLVNEISEYLKEHYQEELTTDSIARTFLLSKTQLYNIFKEISGMTVSEYLTECRMNAAKNYLLNSKYSVEIISDLTGYKNISSFSRVFKSKTGCSPLQYKKNSAG